MAWDFHDCLIKCPDKTLNLKHIGNLPDLPFALPKSRRLQAFLRRHRALFQVEERGEDTFIVAIDNNAVHALRPAVRESAWNMVERKVLEYLKQSPAEWHELKAIKKSAGVKKKALMQFFRTSPGVYQLSRDGKKWFVHAGARVVLWMYPC